MSATTSDSTSVSFSAAVACAVAIASHPCARHASAASGSRTIRLRYSVLRPTARPGALERRAFGAGRASALTATRTDDLRHEACACVEELLLHLRPAAHVLDREQLRPAREAQPLRHALHDRAVAVLREDPLRGLRAQEVDECTCLCL